MILYDQLPLDKEIIETLDSLKINYVFQPIMCADRKTVYAYEALMRPEGKTVTELIEEYTAKDKLHILEVATFFGAMQAYVLRGYDELVSLNSFPSICFTDKERKVFLDYFGDFSHKIIIEMLEYPYISREAWEKKKRAIQSDRFFSAVDDFGTGVNLLDAVELYRPHLVKFDRMLITGIDKDREKQGAYMYYLEKFHAEGISVVAEGIETKEECDFLVKAGTDYLQGYYLGRPE